MVFSSNKKLKESVKMEKEFKKSYPTDYILLIAQNLWLTHQILLIILMIKI